MNLEMSEIGCVGVKWRSSLVSCRDRTTNLKSVMSTFTTNCRPIKRSQSALRGGRHFLTLWMAYDEEPESLPTLTFRSC